ncbi:hydrogenase iron-sulfur subunit [Desulfatirhabdium butyrativorans]|uniref:hydrogenase iron-sulfur subunit n=1 Tax=Desulfatirhabdium butyrativorans TaxID=340467 RepID=UPI0004102D22|nr:hydrogenase iron-sulfur subunit [Desulfatirhabdium butyrativorans]
MNPTICVLGTGWAAEQTAARLKAETIDVLRIAPTADPSAATADAEPGVIPAYLAAIQADPGRFTIHCRSAGSSAVYEAQAIVIAEQAQRVSRCAGYGLSGGGHVLALADVIRESRLLPDDKTVVFLLGLAGESQPVVTREVLDLACRYAGRGRAYLLIGNLKVAGQGLEALVQDCRTAGVVPIKFTQTHPVIRQTDTGVVFEFTDEQIGEPFTILADRVVVDESFKPAAALQGIAGLLRLETDAEGFVQADNVHRLPVLTNRSRVFVAGPGRGALATEQVLADAANVALEVQQLIRETSAAAAVSAAIQPGHCVRCLTCYRVCPYGAIRLKARPEVLPEACQRCGICAAECPSKAITLADVADAVILDRIEAFRRETDSMQAPFIVVFGCERSAGLCRDAAGELGLPLPQRMCFIEVPCAGRISLDFMLGAFNRNAQGVLILSCHEGNCHSGQGNLHAKRRTAYLKEMLATIGMKPDRLHARTLAANMPVEFAAVCREFEATIHSLMLS